MKPSTKMENWYESSVVYRIYTRSFCDGDGDGVGDIEGILGKLDYLVQLGVDAVSVDAVQDLGDEDAVATLADAAHDKGLRLVVRLPIYSTSTEHPWYAEREEYADYYVCSVGRGKKGNRAPSGKRKYGKKVWLRQDNGLWLKMDGDRPVLNWRCPALREDVAEYAGALAEAGADGLELDLRALSDLGEDAYAYMEALAQAVRRIHPCAIVVNIGDEGKEVAQRLQFADGITTTSHLPKGVRGYRKTVNLKDLRHVLGQWQLASYGRYMCNLYWENEDTPRAYNWLVGDYGQYRKEAACCMAAAMGLMRGVPTIYQGQEIGMTDCPIARVADIQDPRFAPLARNKLLSIPLLNKWTLQLVGNAVCDHSRTAMPWTDLLKNAGFSTAEHLAVPQIPNYKELNVQSALEDKDSVLHFWQRLMALRKDERYAPVIACGTYNEYYSQSKELLVYGRSYKGTTIVVVCNMRAEATPFAVPNRLAFNDAELLLNNYDMPAHLGAVTLRPYECVVYRLK